MKNLKLPHKIATGKKINFTTTSKYYANRDERDRLKKNEALFEINPQIKTSSHLADETSQSSDELFDLLKKNKEESLNNCHSSDLSMHDAEAVCTKAGNLFSKYKSRLDDEKRREAEYNLNKGAADSSHPNHNTEEERSMFMIDRSIKRLIGAIYRAKSVEEVVSNTHATKDTVSKAEFLITELNSLSHNIKTLTENNEKIRTELRNRNISLTEDALTTFMDLPSDFGDID
jgi:hypothetical protein